MSGAGDAVARAMGPGASYIVRFDDICDTMNWRVWDKIERTLDDFDVTPVVAVVPVNRDTKLIYGPADASFWSRVRAWQQKGWTIGLHGYQHYYETAERGLIGIARQSEFAGLSIEIQTAKLRAALEIFSRERVTAGAWVAPSHSFDRATLTALKHLGITTISDGHWRWPGVDAHGILWIPQQLWRFQAKRAGVWTVCLHHNRWSDHDAAVFQQTLGQYRGRMTSVPDVVAAFQGRRLTMMDRIDAGIWRVAVNGKSVLRSTMDKITST